MHLPYLAELPQFEIVGVADVAPEVLVHIEERYAGTGVYADYRELLARDDLDVVAVLTPDHAAIAEEVVCSGRHAFVEKPLCFGAEEGERLLAAAEEHGVLVMVGYMRRYDPAYALLERSLTELGAVRFVRARDILGIRADPTAIYTTVLPQPATGGRASSRPGIAERLMAGLGSDDERLIELYWSVLMLGIHDFSVLRGLLGAPSEVASTALLGPRHILTTLRYESGAHVALELGVFPERTWSDTTLEVITDDATIGLTYANSWIRYAPTQVVRRWGVDGATMEQLGPHSNRDPYREEWLELHRAIVEGREPATPGRDGLADVELSAAVVRAIPAAQLDRTFSTTR
jgi:predicted dehydrogenase